MNDNTVCAFDTWALFRESTTEIALVSEIIS